MKKRLEQKVRKRPFDKDGRTVYVATIRIGYGYSRKVKKRRQVCRLDSMDWDDPIMRESGCSGDFRRDFEIKDRAEGCPACIEAGMP